MQFEWDPPKALANESMHGVSYVASGWSFMKVELPFGVTP